MRLYVSLNLGGVAFSQLKMLFSYVYVVSYHENVYLAIFKIRYNFEPCFQKVSTCGEFDNNETPSDYKKLPRNPRIFKTR